MDFRISDAMVHFKEQLINIKAFIFDIDGVLSLQTININPVTGYPVRTVNLHDGYALQLAVKKGYHIGIISGSDSIDYMTRLNSLGITDIYLNSAIKTKQYNLFREKYQLLDSEIIYMGDDIPDYEVMKMAGISACPADASSEIKETAMYVSEYTGGNGCVRDIIEQVLRIHNNWMTNDAFNW